MSGNLTERDKEILAALDRVRAMTTAQIKALYFPGTTDLPLIRRMKVLMSIGMVHRTSFSTSAGGRPVYVYARKKIKVGHLFLSHIVDISEVYVRFHTAGYPLDEWILDSELKKESSFIIPDASFVVTTPEKPYRFLLEVDKGTEILKGIAQKFINYRTYFQPDNGPSLYEQRYKTDRGRVLFVAPSPQRMQHMKAVCEQQGGRMRYWFTSMQQLKTQNVLSAPIWQRAGSEEFFPLI